MNINRNEALRYMGYGNSKADERVLALLEWAIASILDCAHFGNVWLKLPCNINLCEISIGPLLIHSKDLSKNLKGCDYAIVFAATLGSQVDMLQKRYTHMDISKAVVLQAAAAAIIEDYCNQCQETILTDGLFLRPRYSPGYGDFSLKHQPEILSLLDSPRKIGLTATESCMLAPSKSVTAIMGITNENCQTNPCLECNKSNCAYKRS